MDAVGVLFTIFGSIAAAGSFAAFVIWTIETGRDHNKDIERINAQLRALMDYMGLKRVCRSNCYYELREIEDETEEA